MIPNFRLYRVGVVRNVDPSLSIEDIKRGLSWINNHYEIVEIKRLKFLSRNTNQLEDSSSVKITFNAGYLSEIYLESVWTKLKYRSISVRATAAARAAFFDNYSRYNGKS